MHLLQLQKWSSSGTLQPSVSTGPWRALERVGRQRPTPPPWHSSSPPTSSSWSSSGPGLPPLLPPGDIYFPNKNTGIIFSSFKKCASSRLILKPNIIMTKKAICPPGSLVLTLSNFVNVKVVFMGLLAQDLILINEARLAKTLERTKLYLH